MKTIKNLVQVVLLVSGMITFAQTGMGTPTPRGALDINRPLTNTFGLVLPTNADPANMLNPQGGTIAEGTMMYDSTNKCVKYFDGNTWSNCLNDAVPPSTLVADCSATGFKGTFVSGKALSGVTFTVKITNNSLSRVGPITFQNSDLVFSGVSGVSVSSMSPSSSYINSGQSITITYNLTGTPSIDGTLTGTWSKVNLSCTKTVNVGKAVRWAYWGDHSIGGSHTGTFKSQLENSVNYGSTGTYSGNFTGFSFINITSTLSNMSAQDLRDKYDVICTGHTELKAVDAAKIKEYVDKGGVAIILCHSTNTGNNLFKAFGGTGSITSSSGDSKTNNNSINNGVFGNTANMTLKAYNPNSASKITASMLPPGTQILAENNANIGIFITGNDHKAIFYWDMLSFYDLKVTGNIIDTDHEKSLHNIMAYALGKL